MRAALAASLFLLPVFILSPFSSFGCLFHEWAGLPCPLCGGTRALHALLEGNFLLSLYYNPLALLFLIGVLAGILICLWESLTGRTCSPARRLQSPRLFPVFSIALVSFWIFHVVTALALPKPELLNPNGLLVHMASTGTTPNGEHHE